MSTPPQQPPATPEPGDRPTTAELLARADELAQRVREHLGQQQPGAGK